jgi:hypothetical protein
VKMDKPDAMLTMHRAGQQLELAMRTAAESGLTMREVADMLGVRLNTARALAAAWKLDRLW